MQNRLSCCYLGKRRNCLQVISSSEIWTPSVALPVKGIGEGVHGPIDTSRGAYSSYANKLDGSKQTAVQIDAIKPHPLTSVDTIEVYMYLYIYVYKTTEKGG